MRINIFSAGLLIFSEAAAWNNQKLGQNSDIAPQLVYKERGLAHYFMSSTRNNELNSWGNCTVQSTRRQGIFWILTIPESDYSLPESLPNSCAWIKGQLEEGASGFRHWQIVCAFSKKLSLNGVKLIFGRSVHAELTKSSAANDYVHKDASSLGSRFELGVKPFSRNSKRDWESIWTSAKSRDLESIPADVRVVSFRTLQSIAAVYDKPVAIVRTCKVFWGSTGTGKSRLAWEEAGMDAYPKGPRSKFWCGYQGEENVIIDEFRGGIDLAYMLLWTDRYPVRVEVKGSSRPLVAKTIWITSNLDPRLWYPEADEETVKALMRRLTITHFSAPL